MYLSGVSGRAVVLKSSLSSKASFKMFQFIISDLSRSSRICDAQMHTPVRIVLTPYEKNLTNSLLSSYCRINVTISKVTIEIFIQYIYIIYDKLKIKFTRHTYSAGDREI